MTSTASPARFVLAAAAALLVVVTGLFAQGVDVAAGPRSTSPAVVGRPPSSPPSTDAEDPGPLVPLPTVVPGSGGSDGGSSEGDGCPSQGTRPLVGVACDSDLTDPG